jgi:hypothetical protein
MRVTASLEGVDRATKRINRAVTYGKLNRTEVAASYRKVSGIFIRKARSMTKDYPTTIRVRRGKTVPMDIEPGTLRRSFGNWHPSKKFPTILAGPRANHPMARKVQDNADGWFAHIVEEGDFNDHFGGNQKGHPNYKVTERAIKATKERMRQKLYGEIQKNFLKFMR